MSFDGREQLFKQEYPLIWQEAFINSLTKPLIEYNKIYEARRNNFRTSELEPLIAGIDVARTGNDRTVITLRQGRKILEISTLINKTAPELEGFIINKVINKYNPDRIFVDAGYGLDIVEHLRELGFRQMEAIFFNAKPNNPDKYTNLRSEMHDNVRKWFYQEGGVDVKDIDEVCNEYSIIPDLKTNSLGKLYMIDKEEIKKTNQNKSPDYMDSLALTFARPVIKQNNLIKKSVIITKSRR